jgi:2,4-dienoyl-CoA reductase-like NADH-dependent reductase (Old Yellow Enzyme family)
MPQLLDPLKVGSLELRNRIVIPPMATNYANNKGEVTDKLIEHYVDRTKDLGLLIVEHSFVAKTGRVRLTQLGAHSDHLIPGLSKLVDAVHENNTPLALQINHGGGTTSRDITGSQPIAPSSVMHPRMGNEIPHELSLDEIKEVIYCFKRAAFRAAKAGFDAVEVHGAHGYLLGQFMSPLTNKRKDDYGGSLKNRARLSCKIIDEIRGDLGPDFPIFYRLGAEDMYLGGLSLQEGVEAAKMFVDKGVDILDVSGGLIGDAPEGLEGPGYFVPQAAAIKKAVNVPVIGVGGINTAHEADEIIRSGKVDLVAIGRAILKEPKWASRVLDTLRR